MSEACSAYRGTTICANGFLATNAICHGRSKPGCHQCGTITRLPPCLDDDVIRYHADDAGMPLLAHYRRIP